MFLFKNEIISIILEYSVIYTDSGAANPSTQSRGIGGTDG
jgi:hypothetical protein